MKFRILALAVLLGLGLNVNAQSSKVSSAYLLHQDAISKISMKNYTDAAKDLEQAIEAIESAINNEKSMIKEKTWRYRGDIYTLIVQYSDIEEFKCLATMSFEKLTNPTKSKWSWMIREGTKLM